MAELREFLGEVCFLSLKDNAPLNRSDLGLTFCGSRVLPGVIRLTPRKKRRYRYLRNFYESAWRRGEISELQLQRGYDAVLAATLPADSGSWRQRDLQIHPCLYDNELG